MVAALNEVQAGTLGVAAGCVIYIVFVLVRDKIRGRR